MSKFWTVGASALALVASAAFAQTTTTITEDGKGNKATTTQNGDLTSTIMIEQIGNSNSATATQTGSTNTLEIYQSDPLNIRGQTGGDPNLFANNNIAVVNQGDTGNAFPIDARIIQTGDGNRIDLDMTGLNNRARSTQLGDRNTIDADIHGSFNYSRVVQGGRAFGDYTGMGNDDFYGNATTGCSPTTPCVYEFVIDSNNNYAKVFFDAGASNAINNIAQSGSDNSAEVNIYADGSRSEIQQECGGIAFCGNNTANVAMNVGAFNAISEVFQTGVSNSALVTRNHPTATTTVNQTGSQNSVIVNQ
jgi:hypothetical protein